jgi:type I restriction enzyme M protein
VIDAVIGLPSNIFYGTGIPTCILVLKKCRKNPGDILFINASEHFEKFKTTNVMREEHITKIVTTYQNRVSEEKYSNVVSIDLVKKNDWNLNIPRYVDSLEVEENFDLDFLSHQLTQINKQINSIDQIIAVYCEELQLTPPIHQKG